MSDNLESLGELVRTLNLVRNKQIELFDRLRTVEERVDDLLNRFRPVEDRLGRLEKLSAGRAAGYGR